MDLTKYDFWSISNATHYCHCRSDLSPLDTLGLEVSYPAAASHDVTVAVVVEVLPGKATALLTAAL